MQKSALTQKDALITISVKNFSENQHENFFRLLILTKYLQKCSFFESATFQKSELRHGYFSNISVFLLICGILLSGCFRNFISLIKETLHRHLHGFCTPETTGKAF